MMFKLKISGIVIVMFSLFLFGIGSSGADFEITESPSDSDTYLYGGWTYDTFSVKTSEPYYTVNYSIGGVQVYSSSGDGITTASVYCPTNTLTGNIEGITYQIDIEA